MAQTLTCNIGGVAKDVTVSWKDEDGVHITPGKEGYAIEQGSADPDKKIQTSTLTINVSILTTVPAAGIPVTYQCAAKSKGYPDSATSTYKDVVVSFLTFGKFLRTWE